MKSIQKITLLLMVFGIFQHADAQFFKKLKDKVKRAAEETVDRKVEDKAVETTEKVIDSVFTIGKGKKKRKKKKKSDRVVQDDNKELESYGTATLSGPNHGPINIVEIAQPKVTLDEGSGLTEISAWWVTHGTDTNDRFAITINQLVDETTTLPLTVNLPQDGNLTIYYDGLLGAYLPADDWQRKEDPEFELVHNNPQINGTLTLSALNDQEVQFSFDGSGFSGQVQVNTPRIERITSGTNTSSTEKKSGTSPAFTLKDGEPGIYDFDFEIKTQVSTDEGESYPISYLINSSTNYFGMKADMSAYGDGEVEGNSVIVMDKEKVRVFVDTPMMKIQMNQDIAGGQAQQMPEMGEYDYTQPQKTGKTKTIIGYTCEEYVVTHNEGTVRFWAAPEVSIPNWMFGSQQAVEQTGVLGFVMEFSATSKSGTTKSTVTAINDDIALRINAKDYKKMF
ncbi:MAG: DUF4412 domain-containing protein [Bacteroidota bacterium]